MLTSPAPALRCLALLALALAAAAATRSCEEHEKCVALTACPSLRRLAATRAALTEDDRARLRAAQCGWAKEAVPEVCCPVLPLDECGLIYNTDKMIFSPIVNVFEAPWLARLGYRLENGSLEWGCSASLVSGLYLATTAHCVAPRAPVAVRLGDLNTDTDPDCSQIWSGLDCAAPALEVAVDAVLAHPEYVAGDASRRHDIALVRLQRAVVLGNDVRPLCLPRGGQDGHRPRRHGVVHGWATQANNGSAHHLVRKGMQAELPADACAAKLGMAVDAALQTCVVPRHQSGACLGDPGGSLTAQLQFEENNDGQRLVEALVGVLSFGSEACANGTSMSLPTVFTRVEPHLPWILARLREGGVVY